MAGEGLAEAIIEGAGIAGTPMGGILSVQGVSGGTALMPLASGDSVAAGAPIEAGMYAFNSAAGSWDRVRQGLPDASSQQGVLSIMPMIFDAGIVGIQRMRQIPGADAQGFTGIQGVAGLVVDESSGLLNRLHGLADDVDAVAVTTVKNRLVVTTRDHVLDGTAWNRRRGSGDQAQTAVGGANAIATLTLGAPGAGLRQYITYLRITRNCTAAVAGGAILTIVVVNANLVLRTGNAMVAGVNTDLLAQTFPFPLRAIAANTALTMTAPAAGATVSWDMECHYYNAP